MLHYEFYAMDAHIPGTVIGLHKAKRYENKTDAIKDTKTWDDDGTWVIEPIEDQGGKLLFYAVAILDCEDGEIVGFI